MTPDVDVSAEAIAARRALAHALTALCPYCRADPGEACRSLITEAPLLGPAPHFQRLIAADRNGATAHD